MPTQPIPFYKWLQVHKSILLAEVLAHEATHNLPALKAVDARMQKVTNNSPLTCHDDDMLAALAWMILARAYEIINDLLDDQQKQEFYHEFTATANSMTDGTLKSFSDVKTKYKLAITVFVKEDPNQFPETMWAFVKALRNALSHVDYKFDVANGKSADKELIIIEHQYRGDIKFQMSATVDNFFRLARHIGIWMDTSLQKLDFIAPSPYAITT